MNAPHTLRVGPIERKALLAALDNREPREQARLWVKGRQFTAPMAIAVYVRATPRTATYEVRLGHDRLIFVIAHPLCSAKLFCSEVP